MLARAPDPLQSADSVLGQGASNSVPMVSKSGVSIPHSAPVLQIVNPLGFQNRECVGGCMGLFSQHCTRAGVPDVGPKPPAP